MADELQLQIDAITRDSTLSQDQKFAKIQQLTQQANRARAAAANNAILQGQTTFNQLTRQQQTSFTDQAVLQGQPFTPGSKYNPAAIDTINASIQQMVKNQQNQMKIPGWMGVALKPIETLGSSLWWVWSNTVSRWTSFAFLEAHSGIQSLHNLFGGNEDILNFQENWESSKEFSPAQSLLMAPMTEQQLRDRGIDIRNPKMKGFQAEKWFTKGWQKWVTGTADAAYSFWADPLVIAGRAAGGLRRATFVKPFSAMEPAQIDARVARRDIQSMFGQVDSIKANSVIDGSYSENLAIERVRDILPTAVRSAGGDAFAVAIVRAQDDTERALVMKAAMGDERAITELGERSIDTQRTLRVANESFRPLDTAYGSMSPQLQNSMHGQAVRNRLDILRDEIAQADQQFGLYTNALASANRVDALYYNRVTTPVGNAVRRRFLEAQAAKAEYEGILSAPKVFYQNFNSRIVRILRSPRDVMPTSYVDFAKADSYKSVKAAYRDLPRGFFGADDVAVRAAMVGEYVAASQQMRPIVLARHERSIVSRLAQRHGHGMTAAQARELYEWYDASRKGMQRSAARSERYSAAPHEGSFTADVIDHTPAGGSIFFSPVLSTQIARTHQMLNYREFEKVLKVAGPQWQRILNDNPTLIQGLRTGTIRSKDTIGGWMDTLGSYWKVAQLARLGYGPRAIGDEFASQVAALGGIAMLARVGEGLKNAANDNMIRLTRGQWQFDKRIAVDLDRVLNQARLEQFTQESMRLQTKQNELTSIIRDPKTDPVDRRAAQTELDSVKSDKLWVDSMHGQTREAIEGATAYLRGFGSEGTGRHGKVTRREKQGLKPVRVEGIESGAFAGAFRGATGPMYRSSLESQSTFAMQFGVDADRAARRIRGNGWETITAADGESRHMSAWLRDLNRQIRQDPLARQVLAGKDIAELRAWLRTPEGARYLERHPMGRQMSHTELAERVKVHVDHYLDPNVVGADGLRAALLTRNLEGQELKNVFPDASTRPAVNSENLAYIRGQGAAAETVASLLDGFYKYMNALPAEFLSRNPLFNQLYRSHINEIGGGLVKQGKTHLSPQEYDRVERAAKDRALRDTKRLTFNMDYENRLTHAVRFIYPFMGAQSESWARWARIIADKPQVVAHFGNLYNMPMRLGVTTDYQGNVVGPDGYATNPETGERYQVDKTEVMVNVVIPKFLRESFRKATGMAATELQVPLNSFNLVTPDKTWFIPSAGPVVQIPANKLVTSGFLGIPEQFDKADLMADLGILPYGPRDSWTDFINPASGRRLGDSQDEYSDAYQKAMFEIAQEEAWKYQNGSRQFEPDWDEIKKRARQYTTFKFFINFVSPVTVDTANPYDFYRDAYKRMVKEDPKNGEYAFRDKYGDSMWMFAQTLSKNNGGLPASDGAVRATAAFKELQDSLKDPSLMKLIAGPYAEGSFSPGAYYYQLNHPVQTGSNVMQREKLTAREAFEQAKQDEGWYQYNKVMVSLQQQLFARGLSSYEDKGAEDLLAKKRGIVNLLGSDKLNDGRDNPYYNPQWKKDYDVIDRGAYDRRINDMWTIVNNPIMQAMANEGSRTDIATLRDYLLMREKVETLLSDRFKAGGSKSITAKSNRDLRQAFNRATNTLIERDTRFGELHNRYLSKDMGYEVDFENEDGG